MLGNFCVEGMHFHAFHGDLEVERELGQVFSIDISLSYESTKQCMDQSSSSSLRGADIYDHIKSIVMGTRYKSLDGLALTIAKNIFEMSAVVQAIEVTISRRQLFIAGDVESIVVGVAVERQDLMGA